MGFPVEAAYVFMSNASANPEIAGQHGIEIACYFNLALQWTLRAGQYHDRFRWQTKTYEASRTPLPLKKSDSPDEAQFMIPGVL